jgi:hypothetical protein
MTAPEHPPDEGRATPRDDLGEYDIGQRTLLCPTCKGTGTTLAADGGRPSEPQVIDLMQPVVEMCRGIEALAAAIREVDGDHSLGAGALAEALWKRGYRAVDFGRGRVAAEPTKED